MEMLDGRHQLSLVPAEPSLLIRQVLVLGLSLDLSELPFNVFSSWLCRTLFSFFPPPMLYTCIMCPGAWCEGLIAGSRCHWNQITELTTGRNTAGPAHSGVKKHWDGSSFKITVTNNVTALSLISELSAFGEAFRWKDGIHASLFTRITPNPLHCDNSFQLGVESLL